MMSKTEIRLKDAVSSDYWDAYEPLETITKDRYGRRSRAWRHKASDRITSETELMEANTTYKPQLNFFRRQDKLTCFQISMFGGIQNAPLKTLSVLLCSPFMLTYLGYSLIMTVWDKWRAGPPESG